MVSGDAAPEGGTTVKFGRQRASVILRRGRTRRGYWVTVTAEDQSVIGAVERALVGTGLPLDLGDRAAETTFVLRQEPSVSAFEPGSGSAPIRWSYEWADLVVREEADSSFHIYRKRHDARPGTGGSQLEELAVTPSREHALLEMGALLAAAASVVRPRWSPRRPAQDDPAQAGVAQAA